MNKYLIPILLLFVMAGSAVACNTEYNITLQTFGEGVLVELRSGIPGESAGETGSGGRGLGHVQTESDQPQTCRRIADHRGKIDGSCRI